MKRNDQGWFWRRGFTLIEVLLTVMIVAFLAGSLYAVFVSGIKLDQRAKQVFMDLDESRLITEQFYKDFGRIVYYDFRGSYVDRKSFFADETQLIFIIDDNGELKWVRYTVRAEDKTKIKVTRLGTVSSRNVAVSNVVSTQGSLLTLVRDENDFVHFFDPQDIPQKREVLTGRVPEKGWQVYFSPVLNTQPKMEWKLSWDENFLPAAVRVVVSIRSQSGLIKKVTRDFVIPAGGRDEP